MEYLRVSRALAEIVRRARNDERVAGDVLRVLHGELGSKISAIMLQCEGSEHPAAVVRGVSQERMERYRSDPTGECMDPLLSASVLHRAPVHDRLLFPRDSWREQHFYRENARRWGTEHYLVCPILGATSVIGTIHFARSPHHRGFGATELHMAAIVTAHVSVALSVRAAREGLPRLSVRELQVSRLAADGMNNLEIAVRLGIARETVKKTLQRAYTRLGVRSRAQLAAMLARAGLV